MKKMIMFIAAVMLMAASVNAATSIDGVPQGGADDTAYNATSWDGVTGIAPSKNAVRDKIEAMTGSFYHIDDILTALGIASEATHFGTFTGSTIADNQTAKVAIQSLETAVETKQAADADLTTYAGITPSADVQTMLGSANNAAIVSNIGAAPAAGSTSVVSYGPTAVQTASCTANALTFTPTAGLGIVNATITQTGDANCAVTMEDTSAVEGTIAIIKNGSDAAAETLTFTTAAGKLYLIQGSPFAMGLNESLTVQFKDGVWYEIGRVSASFGLSSLTLGGIAMGDATPDSPGEVGFDGTDKYLFFGANSEDLYLRVGSTANNVIVGTNTGVTDINWSALNHATTGTIQGGIKISSDADGMDAAAMTAAGMYGTLFIATGAGTWILPTAVAGMSACLLSAGAAANLILDVTANDYIILNGTTLVQNAGITQAAAKAAGDFVCVVATAASYWTTLGIKGTWITQ